jgi:hypothetical protein
VSSGGYLETSCLEGLVYPFIPFTSIPLVVSNLILVYPPQSDCEKIHYVFVLEGLVMDSKSASEEDDSHKEEIAHLEEFNGALKELLGKRFVSHEPVTPGCCVMDLVHLMNVWPIIT